MCTVETVAWSALNAMHGYQPNSTRLKAQTVHVLGITLPFLGNFDDQIQIHSGPQQLLNILSCPLTNGAKLFASLTDDDALLAVTFDIDLCINVGDRFVFRPGPQPHLGNYDRQRVR